MKALIKLRAEADDTTGSIIRLWLRVHTCTLFFQIKILLYYFPSNDYPIPGAHPGFLERGFLYIKVCGWGWGGSLLLILSHFS